MTTLREAAQQALDALEVATTPRSEDRQTVLKAQAALREALAQPEPEPVAIVVAAEYEDGSHAGHRLEWRGRNEANDYPEGTEFYITPPAQRKPLTEDEIRKLWDSHTIEVFGKIGINPVVFARYLERAHGIGGEE